MVAIPDGYADLLERPLFAHLATVRPDGAVQVEPMWFDWNGEVLKFTHTATRQKYRNVKSHPQVAVSIIDPDNPYRFLGVRGEVEHVEPDPTGGFYLHLANRYEAPWSKPPRQPPPDAPDRVVLVMRPTRFSKH